MSWGKLYIGDKGYVPALQVNKDGNPVGTVITFAGTTAPQGYLLCDGRAVSRTVYSELFSVIGTTYGPGDGSSSFNLPDETPNIYLVDKQEPTSENNHSYYRLYSDGYIIQGGFTSIPANSKDSLSWVYVNFLKLMFDGNYSVYLTRIDDPGNTYAYTYRSAERYKNGCNLAAYSTADINGPQLFCWEVKGMSEQGPITNSINKYIKF